MRRRALIGEGQRLNGGVELGAGGEQGACALEIPWSQIGRVKIAQEQLFLRIEPAMQPVEAEQGAKGIRGRLERQAGF